MTSLSTNVNAQIRDIRTANTTASSIISEVVPVTFAGADAAGRPVSKDLYVGLATSNVLNATSPNTTIHDVTSDELKKKTAEEKFSSVKKSN